MRSKLMSIRVRLLGGFLAVIAVFVLAIGVVLVMGERVTAGEAARDAAFVDLGRSNAVAGQVADTKLRLAIYRASGAASDRAAFVAAMSALEATLAALPGGSAGDVSGHGAAMATAIGNADAAASALAEAVSTLANPVTTMSEVAGRAGNADLTDKITRLQDAYARAAGAAGRYAGSRMPQDNTMLSEAVTQMRAVASEIQAQEGISPRMRRLATASVAAMEKLTATREALANGIAALAKQSRETEAVLASHAAKSNAVRAAAAERFAAIAESARDVAASQRRLMLGCSAVATLLGLGLALGIGRATARPVVALGQRMEGMAAGELDSKVPGTGRRDEIGAMARSTETFRAGLSRARELQLQAEAERRDAEQARVNAMGELANKVETSLGAVVQGLAESAQTLDASVVVLSETADHTAQQAVAVATGAMEATTNVQTVAAATEQLAASVREISQQLAQATEVSQKAVREAQSAQGTIDGLSDAAAQIGDVVRVIDRIAAQTRMLALNATIEAASAGEAGRGFAVVANEVKELATQTARATEQISNQVAGMRNATALAVGSIRDISEVVGQVDQIAAVIASSVEQQGVATNEIARNVAEAARGTGSVSANITHVRAGAEQNSREIVALRDAAAGVASRGNELRSTLRGLVDGLRSA